MLALSPRRMDFGSMCQGSPDLWTKCRVFGRAYTGGVHLKTSAEVASLSTKWTAEASRSPAANHGAGGTHAQMLSVDMGATGSNRRATRGLLPERHHRPLNTALDGSPGA